jgi:N-methylhydantoinase B
MATDIKWDGKVYPYIPSENVDYHPSLQFHDDADEVDAVTHEVLRHALWNVNVEHGSTIMKISGSPSCAFGHDFNPAILDPRGDFVFFGPYLQYLAPATSAGVKWTMEYRSENPGIEPGDMFLFNDPWVGATHQSDVGVLAPIFVDGRLFCWVGNTLHQWDMGGTAPGGFNPMAEDVFWEAPCIPPAKIIEAGVVRHDLEEWFVRPTRMPELVALDLRAMTTGCRVAVERIEGLCERYGAAAVKGSMRKLQDDSEAAFLRRMETIPDGTWTEEAFMESALPGDREIYRNRVTLTKEGQTLKFTNNGTAPQKGTLSGGFGAWKGAVVSLLNVSMLYDQMLCIEGALRHCVFEVEPGTMSCPTYPAAVSGAPPLILIQSIGLAGLALSKMLGSSSDAEMNEEVASCIGAISFPINAFMGLDQRGKPYSSFLMDPIGAAGSAHPGADGTDTGGYSFDLQSTMPNVEGNELFYPILYLWRKELPDSGGAGEFRGGNSAEFAIVPHKTDAINWFTVSSAMAVPLAGLYGGFPTSTNSYLRLAGAKVGEQFAKTGRMPTSIAEVGGEQDWVPAKSFDRVVTPEDVWVSSWGAASGLGDPIDREPDSALADVIAGRVSAEWAREAYGVVIEGGGPGATVDTAATEALRQEIRDTRLAEAVPFDEDVDGVQSGAVNPADSRVSPDLSIVAGMIRSEAAEFGPASRNYKLGALYRDRPITESNPNLRDPGIYTDRVITLREIIEPGTGRLLHAEVVVDDEPPVWDTRPGQTVVER